MNRRLVRGARTGGSFAGSDLGPERGLLARGPLESGQGLLIDPCGSVHTLFMGYALDVVFLGSDWVVRKVSARVAPWRMAACSGAVRTLELGGDEASRAGIAPGMRLRFMARPS